MTKLKLAQVFDSLGTTITMDYVSAILNYYISTTNPQEQAQLRARQASGESDFKIVKGDEDLFARIQIASCKGLRDGGIPVALYDDTMPAFNRAIKQRYDIVVFSAGFLETLELRYSLTPAATSINDYVSSNGPAMKEDPDAFEAFIATQVIEKGRAMTHFYDDTLKVIETAVKASEQITKRQGIKPQIHLINRDQRYNTQTSNKNYKVITILQS